MSVPSLPGQIINEPAHRPDRSSGAHFNTNSNANASMADKFSDNEGNPNQMVIGGMCFSICHDVCLTVDKSIILLFFL